MARRGGVGAKAKFCLSLDDWTFDFRDVKGGPAQGSEDGPTTTG